MSYKLFIPGPIAVSEKTLRAMAQPMIGHRSTDFVALYQSIQPDLQSVVMKPETADQLASMMSRVVEEGTGTAAALAGIRVAGKTGTAEVGANREFTQPWFICFAPVDNPRLAVAVTVERTTGQGGTVAAPIAKAVLEAVLGGGTG